MPRPKLKIAGIFRAHGPAWRQANAGHVSLSQFKVMSAIEACRTEALGGHVAGCTKCGHHHIAYNSCKNRHCPKCQGPAARDWMEARAEDLLPVEYFRSRKIATLSRRNFRNGMFSRCNSAAEISPRASLSSSRCRDRAFCLCRSSKLK